VTKYIIRGGKTLNGEVQISGAKNAAVAIIPAALMVDGICRIENIPQISDVTMLLNILKQMGAEIHTVNRHTMDIDCSGIRETEATFDMMRRIRASYYIIGALLGRFGTAKVAMPGGCNFGGVRPIDQHIKGFTAMGAVIEIKNGIVNAETAGRLEGASIYLDVVSVGATINIMLAATLAEGRTFIENAAKEPHIVDLANFLNSMGADIRGAGTNVIKINGVKKLTGGFYSIIPDQIEAGTYMAAVAGTGGEVTIKNVIPKHLECISGKLREMGVSVDDREDSVIVSRTAHLTRTNVKTMPYPGFPTDMQPQISTLLCLAEGTSIVTEGVWDNRYKYVDELAKMGCSIQVNGRTAVIEGVGSMTGAPLKACDLRAGAALVIAGLCANGTSEIEGVSYIERGYENLVEKLKALGADIECVAMPDELDIAEREAG
jgi:UDP-N-acetylglucosamine 1-carboxyvinyltransferase